MGINESTIKLLTEPINHLIDNCGKSDCKSKCGEHCFEFEIDTTRSIVDALPILQPQNISRASQDSNVTLIVEKNKMKINKHIILYIYKYITLYNE